MIETKHTPGAIRAAQKIIRGILGVAGYEHIGYLGISTENKAIETIATMIDRETGLDGINPSAVPELVKALGQAREAFAPLLDVVKRHWTPLMDMAPQSKATEEMRTLLDKAELALFALAKATGKE